MVTFRHRGDFSKTKQYLDKIKEVTRFRTLSKYGQEGVAALASATPIDTGRTAAAWSYRIVEKNGSIEIAFHNTNIQNDVLVAIIIQYGHGTNSGGWVEGMDYINPAIRPVFDRIANEAWREVTRL